MNVSRSSTEPLLEWVIACTCNGTLNGRHDMGYRSEVSPAEDTEQVEMSGWRVIALCDSTRFSALSQPSSPLRLAPFGTGSEPLDCGASVRQNGGFRAKPSQWR